MAELLQVLATIRALQSTLALPRTKERADAVLCAAVMLSSITKMEFLCAETLLTKHPLCLPVYLL